MNPDISPIAVVTTINDLCNTYIPDIKYPTIVVGDVKTNASSYAEFNYISIDYNSKLSELLPRNHYARKNLGYISAKKSECIIDTDDDTYPISDIYDWESFNRKLVVSPRIPNILKEYTDKKIWMRGYPLTHINNTANILTEDTNQTPSVVQSIVDGHPDVDAIWRLTNDVHVSFDNNKCFVFNRGVYTQGNTQATIWTDPTTYHLLYIPSTVSFRFCDILKMYVAQKCLWAMGKTMAVCSPIFRQNRNHHNLMDDFESEISMYTQVEALLDILDAVELKGTPSDIVVVYKSLCDNGVVDVRELCILEEWMSLI